MVLEVDHKLDALIEAQQQLDGKIDGMQQQLDGKIDGMNEAQQQLDGKMDNMEQKMDQTLLVASEILVALVFMLIKL